MLESPLAALLLATQLVQQMPALLEQHKVPGAAIAIVEDGRVVLARGFGWADVQRRVRVTPRTLFNAGSISKPVTAVAVMNLARRGALDLDAPIEPSLGGWRFPDSPFDRNGVTLRRILSHTAGLSIAGVWTFRLGDKLPPLRETLSADTPYAEEIDETWDGKGGVRVILPPGTKWRYSGGGYALAQLAIEHATREEFTKHMQRAVLRPLGMKRSTFGMPPPSLARPYDKDGKEIRPVAFNATAAAGLITNAEDLGRFVASLATRRTPFDEMVSPQPGSSPNPWGNAGWGLGLPLEHLPDGRVLAFHFGGNEGFVGAIASIPQSRVGIAVLTNSSNGLPLSFSVVCKWLSTQSNEKTALCNGVE